MKCINCKGEWTPPPGRTVTECPFCKKPIEPIKAPKIYDSAYEALCFIVQNYGADALFYKNYFSDIAPNLKDERELIKIFWEKGVFEVLKDAMNVSPTEQELVLKRAMLKLPKYLHDSQGAITMLYDLAEALGWSIKKFAASPQNKPDVEPVSKSTSLNRQSAGVAIAGEPLAITYDSPTLEISLSLPHNWHGIENKEFFTQQLQIPDEQAESTALILVKIEGETVSKYISVTHDMEIYKTAEDFIEALEGNIEALKSAGCKMLSNQKSKSREGHLVLHMMVSAGGVLMSQYYVYVNELLLCFATQVTAQGDNDDATMKSIVHSIRDAN